MRPEYGLYQCLQSPGRNPQDGPAQAYSGKKRATIGANATIICGIIIGRYCFIGANAVVTKDVSDYALVIGNPARQTGWACKCGEKLDNNLVCTGCGEEYKKGRNGLEEK